MNKKSTNDLKFFLRDSGRKEIREVLDKDDVIGRPRCERVVKSYQRFIVRRWIW
ncbi:hypothetical protein B188_10190 [Candidatus Brocadiaceae bacterium B188]|nr:hypothetical protein B188_10190 [Candidatus Brocadiaceae bacterium B188]